jgi:replicative DNA helicase
MENTLPHDLEAEAAVLGSCLLDNGAIPYVCSKLTPDSFYMRSHAAVFEAIQDAHEKNETVDEITLRDKLGGRHKELIYALITRVPSSSLLDKWVSVVRKHALARRAILACHNGLRDLEDAGLPDDVVAQIIEDLEGARS